MSICAKYMTCVHAETQRHIDAHRHGMLINSTWWEERKGQGPTGIVGRLWLRFVACCGCPMTGCDVGGVMLAAARKLHWGKPAVCCIGGESEDMRRMPGQDVKR